MLERFTDGGRTVVVFAAVEARALGRPSIDTEHLLLGLLLEGESIAASALRSLGITVALVRRGVRRTELPADEDGTEHGVLTLAARRVLALALAQSLVRGGDGIGPEHILFGQLQEDGGLANRILVELGFDTQTIRERLLFRLARPRPEGILAAGRLGEERVFVDRTWFGTLGVHVIPLAAEIRRSLGRAPDSGDLLVALAASGDAVAAQAFRELGVDPAAAAEMTTRVRDRSEGNRELAQRIVEVTNAKDRAIAAQDFEKAAGLRSNERLLRDEQGTQIPSALPSEAVAVLRRLLGLGTTRSSPPQPPT